MEEPVCKVIGVGYFAVDTGRRKLTRVLGTKSGGAWGS